MNYLDIYYRALIDYRKNTVGFRDCANQRLSVVKADAKNDNITITRKVCTVDTDWVDAIEKGLVHVEKAIREERQFIRSQGEVVDIEKVKNVSRDSVEHLSRHSNLITRFTEGEDIVPDRLYTVERLSDYAVYENRFLYMLLCYLRDFITLRYNKILELEHTYNGSMTMNKNVVMTKRNLSFEVKVAEERKDDLYLKKQSESKDIIIRIGNQLKLVLAFLATPLMQEVSKVAMLKPPITKTNVLRMNHNFRGALALYEFVSAYDKPGYKVEESVTTQSPFRMDVADEMAEIVMLASFLTYEHGLNLRQELQAEYDLEEERRKEEEKRRLIEQLRALRHRIREAGGDPEEYMLMLEKTNRLLQEDRENLKLARQEIEELKTTIEGLNAEKKELNEEITRLNGNIEELKEAHIREVEEINERHVAEINNINEANEAEKQSIRQDYEAQLQEQKDGYEAQLEEERSEFRGEIDALNNTINTEREEHKEQIETIELENARVIDGVRGMWQAEVRGLKSTCREKDRGIEELKRQCKSLEDRRKISEARLTAIRSEHGLISPTEDFTGEEAFQEIEKQLDVFVTFFKKQWGITKRSIKKKALSEYKEFVQAEKEEKRKAKLKKKGKLIEEEEIAVGTDASVESAEAPIDEVAPLTAVPIFSVPMDEETEVGTRAPMATQNTVAPSAEEPKAAIENEVAEKVEEIQAAEAPEAIETVEAEQSQGETVIENEIVSENIQETKDNIASESEAEAAIIDIEASAPVEKPKATRRRRKKEEPVTVDMGAEQESRAEATAKEPVKKTRATASRRKKKDEPVTVEMGTEAEAEGEPALNNAEKISENKTEE